MFTTIIIEDEPPQQEFMMSVLAKNFPEYKVLCCCRSVKNGVEKIFEHKPHLVLLDITLSDGSGFDLLNGMKERNFEVIFCTSHNEYALNAFRVAAVDYLLKPFTKHELGIALGRFEEKMRSRQSVNHLDLLMQNFNSMTVDKARMILPTQTGLMVVDVKDIVRSEADNVYTTFFFADKTKMVTSLTIKECEGMLKPYNFFRCHNSHIINIRCVKEYVKGEGGFVKMTDGSTVDVSRHRKEDFLIALKKG